MEDFVTSDNHLGHYNIVLHCERLPWIHDNPNFDPNKKIHFKYNNPRAVDINAHDEAMIENWNGMVSKKDHVRILGDFAYKNHRKFLLALNGKKTLFKGNHDKMSQDCYNLFEDVVDTSDVKELREECSKWLNRYNKITREDLIDSLIKSIWNKFANMHDFECMDVMDRGCYQMLEGVYEMGARKRVQGQDVTFCHYAMRSWASSCHGAFELYGHSHGRMPEFDNMYSFDVGVDVWGYAPVPWSAIVLKMQKIKEKIEKRGEYSVDGESLVKGTYSKDADERVREIRARNKQIIIEAGYPINEHMW